MDKRQKVAKQGEQGLIWRTFVAIIGTKKRNTEFLDLNKIHFILICFPSYIQTPLRTSPGAAFVYKSVHFAKSLGFSLDTHGGSAIISKDLYFW